MTITFFCLLVDNEGEPLGVPFLLRELENRYITEVADAIREKTNIQTSVNNISLWKANPPLLKTSLPELSRSVKALQLNDTEIEREAVQLRSSDRLGNVFLPHLTLPSNHIHMIAQSRTRITSPIIPPSRTHAPFEIEEIDQLIKKECESLREEVEAFLRSPYPPIWVPPDYVTESDRKFYANLKIPAYHSGDPSLLLHDLDRTHVKKYENIYKPGQLINICNTSGSGKTRRILESLTAHWGFYFVAVPDTTRIGIRDLWDILDELPKRNPASVGDIRTLGTDRFNQSNINSQIAYLPLKRVLAARTVAFQLFLDIAIKVDKKLLDKHKHSWLLFQVSYPGRMHPILRIIKNCLPRASSDALDDLIARLDNIRKVYFPHSIEFIIGLDEAQQAARLLPHALVSSKNANTFQSILRDIVLVFTKQPITLVASEKKSSVISSQPTLCRTGSIL